MPRDLQVSLLDSFARKSFSYDYLILCYVSDGKFLCLLTCFVSFYYSGSTIWYDDNAAANDDDNN